MDEPRTRKEGAVGDDRAEPGVEGGWFAGKDAVAILRRALWGAAGVAGIGLLLAGAGVYLLWEAVVVLRDICLALKG